ncbi:MULTISPECIES: carboxymuconolactone decarboxylase family protein [unclassified Bradyrhizobium]|uniref:carboxymuconolactone decarboxylase family protein n=1 Tax=unclassified Bradyrhizobium TaxID=2631580 RepID=UPI001FF81696|nr:MULTISPECIES: carboxymuconolactone decarboxylase family protein [unclassified Bradyrhizobium]MCK1523846.1 carboxymuconolactone decarboxylase family protein [Bradyrhizobium sp. 17]MCK1574560.1 carboxymuconolactone decarboxylase family protein [Bradyrhizobium sp. 174]MCK1690228.1 carboxymuconolactone decarboxylase family protein [Bradyrhizobium sp. 145]UPJ97441.1 carboxymuconolactone decarboxylase family protein [Bradyrhizobium sp. 172]
MTNTTSLKTETIEAVSPRLARYTRETVVGDLWSREVLAPRDRSLVTVAAMIQRGQTDELAHQIGLALDNGVTATEISETITQLSFYSGWGNGGAAVRVAAKIFAERGIDLSQLAQADVELLPLDEQVEAARVAIVDGLLGPAFKTLADYTTHVLFRDLWLRPALSPRDRSLVTMTALITANLSAQIPYHINKAIDNGMSEAQVAEVITHLGFYAGWPMAMNAANVAKDVFAKRPG